jgi:hypothetical protein
MGYYRFIMALFIFSFVGCDNKSKEADGNCTQAFVSEYNSLALETQITTNALSSNYFTAFEKISKLTILQNACNNFYLSHSGVICRAQVNSVITSISDRDLKPACELATRELQDLGIQTGAPQVTPSTASPNPTTPDATQTPATIPTPILPGDADVLPEPVPSIPTPSVPNSIGLVDEIENLIDVPAQQVKIEVKNVELFKKSLLIEDMVIVNGQVGTVESLAETFAQTGVLCFIGSPQKQDWENKIVFGELFSAVKLEEDPNSERRRISMILENLERGLVIGCVKKSNDDFTVKEIRQTLKGIAEIKIQN